MQMTPLTIRELSLDNPVILAPMAGITSLPYRRIMKSCGAGLVFTEMVSANGLIRDGAKTRQLLTTHPSEFPLGIQLFGSDPEVLAEAVRCIANEASLIDINMGCPVKKVISGGSGSALLREPARIGAILAAVRKAYGGALTIKIRSGWDQASLNFLEVGHIAQEQGVDAVTLHPRTRSQGFSGSACWDHISELKQCLTIPVIGSGDIFSADQGVAMLSQTGCDGIMIGRGGYGNPWLIRDIISLLRKQTPQIVSNEERLELIHRHVQLHRRQFGDHKTLLEMRKHLSWYARGFAGASQFRTRMQRLDSLDEMTAMTDNFFSEAATQ